MKKLRYLALFLIALSCSGCDSSDYMDMNACCRMCREQEPIHCFPNYEAYVESYFFRFRTEPPGATISREPMQGELCTTPCDYTFVGRPVDFSTYITISKPGYESQKKLLNPEFYKDTHGNINIRLDKNKELVFNLVYTPPNAIVYRFTGEEEYTYEKDIICERSPCAYVFDTHNRAETLHFSADGYETHSIVISEEIYNKSSTIRVDLEPVKKQKSK